MCPLLPVTPLWCYHKVTASNGITCSSVSTASLLNIWFDCYLCHLHRATPGETVSPDMECCTQWSKWESPTTTTTAIFQKLHELMKWGKINYINILNRSHDLKMSSKWIDRLWQQQLTMTGVNTQLALLLLLLLLLSTLLFPLISYTVSEYWIVKKYCCHWYCCNCSH